MLYDSIKIIHILSGAIVVTTWMTCVISWWNKPLLQEQKSTIVIKTGLIIIPFSLIQLFTGFTLLNLHSELLSEFWSKGTITCFILTWSAWFLFLTLLSFEKKKPHLEMISVVLSTGSLLTLLFLMANKP